MPRQVYSVKVLVEGWTDEAVVRRVLEHVQLPCGTVYGRRGKDYVFQCLAKYNQVARHGPWLVVVGLNAQYECASLLARRMLSAPAPGMRFRVAVRAIEAWIVADTERLAQFLSIPLSRVPAMPDSTWS